MKKVKTLLRASQITTAVFICYSAAVTFTQQHHDDRETFQSFKDSAFNVRGYANVRLMMRKQIPRTDFEVLRAPWNVTCKDQLNMEPASWSMIVCVKSGIQNSKRRNLIRQTWGSKHYFQNVRLVVLFVVGEGNESSADDIENEELKYGDILQVNVNETYSNVGYKVLAGMRWIMQNCDEKWIYASSDDDMIPYLNKVYSAIEREKDLDSKSITVICHYSLRLGRVPLRELYRKNSVSTDIYSHTDYPGFCAGGFYSMSIPAASAIFRVSRYHHYFFNDDVWITGLLRLSAIDAGILPCRNISDEQCGLSNFQGGSVQHGRSEKMMLTQLKNEYPLHFNLQQ